MKERKQRKPSCSSRCREASTQRSLCRCKGCRCKQHGTETPLFELGRKRRDEDEKTLWLFDEPKGVRA